MCLTLNSAVACAGSMFQVVVDVCGIASVLISLSFLTFSASSIYRDALRRYSLQHMFPPKKLVPVGARGGKQFGERPELVPAEVPQLLAMDFLDWFIQASQKLESLRCNPSDNCATVFVVPRPRDQAPFLHTVEQAGHIGIPS